jgi:hypothetical protein
MIRRVDPSGGGTFNRRVTARLIVALVSSTYASMARGRTLGLTGFVILEKICWLTQ